MLWIINFVTEYKTSRKVPYIIILLRLHEYIQFRKKLFTRVSIQKDITCLAIFATKSKTLDYWMAVDIDLAILFQKCK